MSPHRCYLRVCLEMSVRNWVEQVTGVWAKDKKEKQVLEDLLYSGSGGLCMFPRYEESSQCTTASNERWGAESKQQRGEKWHRGGQGTDRRQRSRIEQEKQYKERRQRLS